MQPKNEFDLSSDGELPFDIPVEATREVSLHRIFRFNKQDLAQNRQGKISIRQHTMLYQHLMKQQPINYKLMLLLLIPIVLGMSLHHVHKMFFLLPIFGILILVTILRGDDTQIKEKLTQIQKSGVKQITGRIEKQSHSIQINNHTFELEPNKLNALLDGNFYTIYYLKYMNRILSIEQTDTAKK